MNPNYLYEMMRNQPLRSDINEPAGVPQTLSGLIAMENARNYAPSQYQFTPQQAQAFDSQAAQGQAELGRWENETRKSGAARQLAQLEMLMKQKQIEGQGLENQVRQAQLRGGTKPQFVDGQWVYPPSPDAPMGRAVSPEGFKPKKDAQAETGKETVSKVLEELKGAFGQLSQKGAAIDTTKGTLSNIQNRIAASAPGQMVTGALGTEEQSIRNTIAMTRPLLIQAIRQATGMSAKAMDSNAELQFYLQAATDPTKDLQANMKAIEALDRAFGLGLGVGGQEQARPAQNPGMAVPVTSEADAMRLPPGTRFKLPDGRTGTAR